MMAWLDHWLTFLIAAVILFVPGALAALIVRLRGFDVLAASAPLSLAMLTAAGLLDIVVPFRWSPLAWVVGTILLLAAASALRLGMARFAARHDRAPAIPAPEGLLRATLPFVVVAVVAILAAVRLMSALGEPSNISQTFDNIYHLNAVRQVMDNGIISPTGQLLPGFYPDLWHIAVSTVAEMSGAGVPASVNVVSVMLGAVVWPVSCLWLVRTIVGGHVGANITAGALAVGMAAFPLLMLDFGVLYPNVLSIALLPSAIAAAVLVSGVGRGRRPDLVLRWLLLVAIVPTLALAHPSTLMAFFLPAFLLAFTGVGQGWLRAEPSGRRRWLWALVAVLLALAVAILLFIKARPERGLAFWPPSATLEDAALQLLSGGLVWRPAAWIVSAAAALGVVSILAIGRWRAQWWLIGSVAAMAFLYLVCIAFPAGGFRFWLTGTWYQDIYRIAALMPAYLVPLGALGVVGVVAGVSRFARAQRRPASRRLPGIVGAALGIGVLVTTQAGPALAEETANTASMYQQADWSPLLTNDERELLARLPDTVPEDDVIVGNPWTGASLSFALADRRALVPHIFQELSPDMVTITENLNAAETDSQVCEALERTRTRWVLDFGSQEIHNGDHTYPGLENLGAVVRLADAEGDARLYEIVACR